VDGGPCASLTRQRARTRLTGRWQYGRSRSSGPRSLVQDPGAFTAYPE
jgi:hypothetical protein